MNHQHIGLEEINNYLFVFVLHNFKNTLNRVGYRGCRDTHLFTVWSNQSNVHYVWYRYLFHNRRLDRENNGTNDPHWLSGSNHFDSYGHHRSTNDHGYVTFIVTIRSFPHPWLITGLVTRRLPQMNQELLTLQEYPSTPPVFSRVRVVRSLVFCVMFCRSLLVLLPFSLTIIFFVLFDLRFLITPFVSSNSSFNSWNNGPQNLCNCNDLQQIKCVSTVSKDVLSKSTHNLPGMLYISVLST